MMDEQSSSANAPALASERSTLQLTHIAYLIGIITSGLGSIVGVIMAYMKKDGVRGTWMQSHYDWLIKTFWYTLAGAIIGTVLSVILIGVPLLFAVGIWYIYRCIKAFLAFQESKDLPNTLF